MAVSHQVTGCLAMLVDKILKNITHKMVALIATVTYYHGHTPATNRIEGPDCDMPVTENMLSNALKLLLNVKPHEHC